MNESFFAADFHGLTRIRQIPQIVTPVTAMESATLYSSRNMDFGMRGLADAGHTVLRPSRTAALILGWNERDTQCI
jgi:hypothetical protein